MGRLSGQRDDEHSLGKRASLLSLRQILERRDEMVSKTGLKRLALSIMLAIPLIIGAASDGFAGTEGGPPGAKISGKAIDSVLTAVLVVPTEGDPYVVSVIVGTCNKSPVVFGPEIGIGEDGTIRPDNIASIKASCEQPGDECVEYYELPDAGPPGCYSDLGGEDLIITRVKNFINAGTAISAEVSVQKIEYP